MIRPESEGHVHVACDIPGSEFQLGLARGLLELQPFCCHLAQPAAHPRGCDASCRCGFMARLRSAASQSFASWNGLSALRRSAHEQRERNQSAREAHAREALFLLFEASNAPRAYSNARRSNACTMFMWLGSHISPCTRSMLMMWKVCLPASEANLRHDMRFAWMLNRG